MPNKALQQSGHANEGSARRYVYFRVSRLLSLLFDKMEVAVAGRRPGGRQAAVHPLEG
jgi:hypothetical protein